MRYPLLGHSGLRVSELCLGTMTFGEEEKRGNTKAESKNVFDLFVNAGGNFFDTANIYTQGKSERYLGEFVQQERDRYVLSTKYTLCTNPKDPNSFGNHRKNLMQSVHESLKRLNTDYIDLLWVHAWDKNTPIEEMMRSLDDLVRQGKVLYIGASNIPAWVVASANTMARQMGWSPFIAVQLEYSLLERTIEREYFGLMSMFDLSLCSWSPIGGGVLTGKYLEKASPNARYHDKGFWTTRYVSERNQTIAEVVVAIAKEIDTTPAQVALNWVRQKNAHILPILGATSVQQLQDNLGCLSFRLSEDQMKTLDQASSISLGFPYDFLGSEGMKPYLLTS